MNKSLLAGLIVVAVVLAVILIPSVEKQEIEIVVENLDTPWAIDFLPDGKMIFTERFGRVSTFDGELKIVAEIDVSEVSESGLLGIAVDPEFNDNRFVYVYYTHETANRISRFALNERLENEVILLDDIPNARWHDGGRLKFGSDGMLYATTGDATVPSSSQDISSLAGKILRMNKDGTVPAKNPFGNYVYSYGHRNPQGIAWKDGKMYASEHGPRKMDEINVIVKGSNYGWPEVHCDTKSEEYINPIVCYDEWTLAPAGIAFHDENLYVTGLRGTQLRKIGLKGPVIEEMEMLSNLGRLRDVVEHDGYLYVATSNKDGRGVPRPGDDKIIRIKK